MSDQSPRRFDIDEDYRDKIKEATYNEFVDLNKAKATGVKSHWFGQYPLNNQVDLTAVAIVRSLFDLSEIGRRLETFEPHRQAGVMDYIAETIRQGMLPDYHPFGEPVERKEYLPPSDPNSPSMQSAKVAIDMVHDFASRDIIYDLWPIDDPIREAALCAVSAVQLKAGRTVEKALAKLPLEQKRALVDTLRSVIEISVDKINHAGDDVHQIGSNDIPTLTPTEQLGVIAKEAHQIAHHWDTLQEPGLGQRERIMGAVHGVLDMFQNGTDNVPAMRLLPTDPQTDQGHVVTLYREGGPVMLDWQYDQPIYPAHPAPSNDAQLFMINSAPGSLTNQFQGIYDTYRDRYRTAAYDLFRDPNDG